MKLALFLMSGIALANNAFAAGGINLTITNDTNYTVACSAVEKPNMAFVTRQWAVIAPGKSLYVGGDKWFAYCENKGVGTPHWPSSGLTAPFCVPGNVFHSQIVAADRPEVCNRIGGVMKNFRRIDDGPHYTWVLSEQ